MAKTHITYKLVDVYGKRFSFGVKILSTALTLAQIDEFADAFGDLLDNVTHCQILGANALIDVSYGAALKGAPDAGRDGNVGALFVHSLTNSEYVESYWVPGILTTLLSGNDVVVGSGAGQAFVTALSDGIAVTGGTGVPVNKFEVDVAAVQSAQKSDRTY